MSRPLSSRGIRAGAFILSILALFAGLAFSPYWLLLLLPFLFLKSGLGFPEKFAPRDERELLLNHKIGHAAFFATYALILLIFISQRRHVSGDVPVEWVLLLVLPPGFYFFGDLAFVRGLRKAGLAIGWALGAFWLLFTLVSHGFTLEGLVESGIGGGILLTTFLALKWPALGGSLFLLEGLLMIPFFLRSGLNASTKFLMLVILALPLLLSGIFILSEKLRDVASR